MSICFIGNERRKSLTDFPVRPLDINIVRTSFSANQMERHMQVPDEMDQELEGFARNGVRRVTALIDPLTEQIGSVTDSPEDIRILVAFPSLGTWEEAQLRRMIGDSIGVVQRCGPPHSVPDLVSPGCDGGEGARFH